MSDISSLTLGNAWLQMWQLGILQFREWINFMGPFTVGGVGNTVYVNSKSSANPAVEEDVTNNIASYGRQLGRISDALLVVLDAANLTTQNSKLTFEQQTAVNQFRQLAKDIAIVKKLHAMKSLGIPAKNLLPGEGGNNGLLQSGASAAELSAGRVG